MNIHLVPTLSTVLLVVIAGCASEPVPDRASVTDTRKADDLLVIDCLLPGQVRKLGQRLSYLAPRRPVRTTASDCEIRGGEYAAYDRANYATALKVWLPEAQQGDPAAQTYVGEIYEKGLGLEADYTLAADWYRMAAEQGYQRAQINLGYLYESGLGVQQNLVTAMNWYRKASGLRDGDVEYVSSIEAAQRRAAKLETAELRQEVGQLSTELKQARAELRQRKTSLAASKRDLSALKQKLISARQAAALPAAVPPQVSVAGDTASQRELEQRLEEAMNDRQRLITKLAEEQLKTGALNQELQRAEDQLVERRQELQALNKELAGTRADLERETQKRISQADNARMLQMQSKLDHLENVVATTKSEIVVLEKEKKTQQQSMNRRLETASSQEQGLQQELEKRDREVVALRMELSERSEVIASFEKKLQEAEDEQERLTAKLAQQQLDAGQLRDNLDKTARDLSSRQDELLVKQQLLVRSRQELEQRMAQQSGENEQEIAQLEARILDLTETLQTQQQQVKAIEKESGQQQVRLSSKLAQTELNERDLQKRLNTRNQEVESLQEQLAIAGNQLAQAVQSDEKITELEKELVSREQEIARQKEEIGRIEAKFVQPQPEEKQDKVEFATLVAARNIGPTIEIIEPPVAVMRGKPSIPLHSELSSLEIIGRVSPATELMSFRINDKPRQTDDSGLFQVAITVERPDTPIHAVAVDKAGRRASLDFVILPKTRNKPALNASTPTEKPTSTANTNIEFGKYYALIIGNNNYRYMTNLQSAKNDAKAVENLLREKYGFKTQLLLDADRYTMLSALNKLMQELTEDDNLLIYYAGHGELDNVNLRGYWLPVDSEQDSSTNWISNVTITDMLNVMSAKHVLVVADSCYSGALTRSSVPRLQGGMSQKAKTEWYKTMANARARAALTSGGVKPVLDSGGGQHSIFAQAFIEVLEQNDGILEGYRLYRDVQVKVKSKAAALRTEQDPQYAPIKYAGHEAGEFFFRPVGSARTGRLTDRHLAINWYGMSDSEVLIYPASLPLLH